MKLLKYFLVFFLLSPAFAGCPIFCSDLGYAGGYGNNTRRLPAEFGSSNAYWDYSYFDSATAQDLNWIGDRWVEDPVQGGATIISESFHLNFTPNSAKQVGIKITPPSLASISATFGYTGGCGDGVTVGVTTLDGSSKIDQTLGEKNLTANSTFWQATTGGKAAGTVYAIVVSSNPSSLATSGTNKDCDEVNVTLAVDECVCATKEKVTITAPTVSPAEGTTSTNFAFRANGTSLTGGQVNVSLRRDDVAQETALVDSSKEIAFSPRNAGCGSFHNFSFVGSRDEKYLNNWEKRDFAYRTGLLAGLPPSFASGAPPTSYANTTLEARVNLFSDFPASLPLNTYPDVTSVQVTDGQGNLLPTSAGAVPSAGFVRDWLLLGPFSNHAESNFAVPHYYYHHAECNLPLETFTSGDEGWTYNGGSASTTDCSSHTILGGYNQFNNGNAEKTYSNLANHTGLNIGFEYWFVDSWASEEEAFFRVDGTEAWSSTYTPISFIGVSNCGGVAGNEYYYTGSASVPHTDETSALAFTSNLDEAASDESFGIDNINISLEGCGNYTDGGCTANFEDDQLSASRNTAYIDETNVRPFEGQGNYRTCTTKPVEGINECVDATGGKWSGYHSQTNFVNLSSTFSVNEFVLAYAYARIYSPENQLVKIKAGADDGLAIWVNGQNVLEKTDCENLKPDNYETEATLQKGWNDLLVKVDNGKGGWGFYLRFVDKNGNPLDFVNFNSPVKIEWDPRGAITSWEGGAGKAMYYAYFNPLDIAGSSPLRPWATSWQNLSATPEFLNGGVNCALQAYKAVGGGATVWWVAPLVYAAGCDTIYPEQTLGGGFLKIKNEEKFEEVKFDKTTLVINGNPLRMISLRKIVNQTDKVVVNYEPDGLTGAQVSALYEPVPYGTRVRLQVTNLQDEPVELATSWTAKVDGATWLIEQGSYATAQFTNTILAVIDGEGYSRLAANGAEIKLEDPGVLAIAPGETYEKVFYVILSPSLQDVEDFFYFVRNSTAPLVGPVQNFQYLIGPKVNGPEFSVTYDPPSPLSSTTNLKITSSVALASDPSVNYTFTGGQSGTVAVAGAGTSWTGTLPIDSTTPEGVGTLAIRGVDSGGCEGTLINIGSSFIVNLLGSAEAEQCDRGICTGAVNHLCSVDAGFCYNPYFVTVSPNFLNAKLGEVKAAVVKVSDPLNSTRTYRLKMAGNGQYFTKFGNGKNEMVVTVPKGQTTEVPLYFLAGAATTDAPFSVSILAVDEKYNGTQVLEAGSNTTGIFSDSTAPTASFTVNVYPESTINFVGAAPSLGWLEIALLALLAAGFYGSRR